MSSSESLPETARESVPVPVAVSATVLPRPRLVSVRIGIKEESHECECCGSFGTGYVRVRLMYSDGSERVLEAAHDGHYGSGCWDGKYDTVLQWVLKAGGYEIRIEGMEDEFGALDRPYLEPCEPEGKICYQDPVWLEPKWLQEMEREVIELKALTTKKSERGWDGQVHEWEEVVGLEGVIDGKKIDVKAREGVDGAEGPFFDAARVAMHIVLNAKNIDVKTKSKYRSFIDFSDDGECESDEWDADGDGGRDGSDDGD